MSKKISRKEFVVRTTQSSLAICFGLGTSVLLQGCKTIQRVQAPVLNQIIRIDQVLIDKKKHLIIENEQLEAPVFLSRNEDHYLALLLLCTHKNCEINPTGKVFTCPCHGSQFDQNGTRMNGPAEKNLNAFKTEIKEGQVIIYLNQKHES